MAKVILNRIDSPEKNDVSLSTGEVSIGRGSILGCDDKRISRKHGLLHVSDDGCITLVSLHSNPCFYKEQNLDTYAVLVKGQSKILSPGDEFALLPNSFRYRINVVKTDHGFRPLMNAPESSAVITTTTGMVQGITSSVGDIENMMPDSVSTTPSKRKRMLPGWLTDLAINKPSSSLTADSSSPCPTTSTSRKRKAPSEVEPVKTVVKEEPLGLASSVDDTVGAGPSGDVKPGVGQNKDGYEKEYGVANSTVALGAGPSGDVKPGVGQNKDGTKEEYGKANSTVALGAGPSGDVKPGVGQNKDGYEEEYGMANSTDALRAGPGVEQGVANSPNCGVTGPSLREPCVYGATCYRKNPQHRTEFSHPEDSDFLVNPGLPECPYGTSCYRKNLQHRKDYKHTNPPAPPSPQTPGNSPTTTRTRPRPTTKDGDDSEDDYDYNDPFLNDASSDDYRPTSSEDSDGDEEEDEDVESQERKRMLREAKKFIKKNKK